MKCPDCGGSAKRNGSYVGANFPPFARTLYYRCKSATCRRGFIVFERIVSPRGGRTSLQRAVRA